MAFAKFTLGDIRSAVKRKLDDPSFDDAIIDEAANDFQNDLFMNHRIRFMEKNHTFNISQGDTSEDLPADFMTLINFIMLDDANTPRNITKSGYMNYDDFMLRYANYLTADQQKVLDWTFFGEGIRFQAPADAAYTAYMDYIRSPVQMTAAASECELPVNAKELATLGTLERVMRTNEDYNESDFEFDRLEPLKTSFLRVYARGWEKTGPVIIKTNRGRVGGYRADRDF